MKIRITSFIIKDKESNSLYLNVMRPRFFVWNKAQIYYNLAGNMYKLIYGAYKQMYITITI